MRSGVQLRMVADAPPADEPLAEVSFNEFWLLYPRRVAKKDAVRAWARVPTDLHVTVLVALASWRRVWAQKDIEYLPYPASWLNGERWEDELPPGFAHQAAQRAPELREVHKRTRMPEHVRELLERLKAGAR